MRKAIVMLLLAAVSSRAAAEWVRAGSTETFTAYVNPATLRKTGLTVKMWQLYDYKSAQSSADDKPYLSTRSRYEYDCSKKRTRQLSVSSHFKNMGAGTAIGSVSTRSAWKPIPPDSVLETMWEIACGKQ